MATSNIRSTRKLKQWLVEKVDSGKFTGLIWDDPDHTSFRIPWKHAGKHDFRPDEDAALFKEWAIFKNKYKDGTKLDAAMWKTRLRCALNKSPEFAEVPARSQLDISEPYKVYRLVPPGEQNGKPVTSGRKRTLKREARDVSSEEEMEPKKRSRSNRITMEVKNEGEPRASSSTYPEDSGIESSSNSPQRSSESPQSDSGSPQTSFDSRQRSSESPELSQDIRLGLAEAEPIETLALLEAVSQEISLCVAEVETTEMSAVLEAGINTMRVAIFYGGQQVFQKNIRTSDCRISSTLPTMSKPCIRMEQISLPPTDTITDPEKCRNTQKLLPFLDKGIMLASLPEGIFVQRFCPGPVFWTGPCSLQPGGSNKLEKSEYVQLFDTNKFLTELELYQSNQGPPPKYQATLCFGEEITENDQTENKLITLQVEQNLARQQVLQDLQDLPENFTHSVFFVEPVYEQFVSEATNEPTLLCAL